MARILVVDDQPLNRQFLCTLLGMNGHHVIEAPDGEHGLASAVRELPDLVISDIVMPRVDGFEFVRRLRLQEHLAAVPVIFFTGIYHQDQIVNLAEACGVVKLLKKPCTSGEILGAVAEVLCVPNVVQTRSMPEDFQCRHIGLLTDTLSRKVMEAEAAFDELKVAYDETLVGWVRLLDLRDKETEGHTQRVTSMTLELARELGMQEEELVHIRRGALLHDIGKIAIPDRILHKPGPLDDAEWAIMRQHPLYAEQMLGPIGYLQPALPIPSCHHEQWNGSGYPRGLRGLEIPLAARVFALVDVWDALVYDRPYRSAWPKEKARAYICRQSGTHFDPAVMPAFLELVARRTATEALSGPD